MILQSMASPRTRSRSPAIRSPRNQSQSSSRAQTPVVESQPYSQLSSQQNSLSDKPNKRISAFDRITGGKRQKITPIRPADDIEDVEIYDMVEKEMGMKVGEPSRRRGWFWKRGSNGMGTELVVS